MDTLDDLLAAIPAKRTETSVIAVTDEPGDTDAASLGGEPVSIHVVDTDIKTVLALLEDSLMMPIQLYHTFNDEPALEAWSKKPATTVTIDLDNVPAGVALQRVLEQMHYRYEVAAGYEITPLVVGDAGQTP